jgi:ABC-type nitrate/sulfonate/bicarbonate transport system permease component
VTAATVAPATATARPRIPRRTVRPITLEVIGLVFGALAWEIVGLAKVSRFLPPLHDVVGRIWDLLQSGQLREPLTQSLRNLLIGYAISVGIGVTIGTLMAVSKYVDYALRIYVNGLMATPSILLVPILYVVFGLSSFTLIAVIVLYATVFIVANTRSAVLGSRHDLTEMSQAFGAHPVRGFFEVTLRSAGPEIFGGLRLGMGRAVKGMFNGELLIAVVGLAQIERNYAGAFDATGILAIALTILIIAVVLTAALEALNRALNSWAVSHSRSSS